MAREGGRPFDLHESITSDAKHPATPPVDQGEDDCGDNVCSADETECVPVNAVACQRCDSAGKRAREKDDIEVECLDPLVGDKGKMLPCVVEPFPVGNAAWRNRWDRWNRGFCFLVHRCAKWPNDSSSETAEAGAAHAQLRHEEGATK